MKTLGFLLLALVLALPAAAQPAREDLDAIWSEVTQLEERLAELIDRLGRLEGTLQSEVTDISETGSLWDEEGLLWQPRLEELMAARDFGFEPGSSPWDSASVPEGFRGGRWNSPGDLLFDLVRDLGYDNTLGVHTWEVTTRAFIENGTAYGAILLWGFQDDAVAGEDMRVTLQEDGSGWYVSGLERRYHCRRGVSEGLCL